MQDDRLEDLGCNGLKIFQNKELYTFTSDSVILANFVKTKPSDVAVEIGAGCGVVSILVQAKNKIKKIFAFEIQQKMQEICKKNLNFNNLNEKIELICEDVKNFEKFFSCESVDVVFSNPPYFKPTKFVQNEVKKLAKEEINLTLSELVKTASKMLKFGGSFYCCFSAERSCELISTCQAHNLKIKEMFFTENGKGEVKLVVIKAVKGGKDGVKVFPNLVTNDRDGNYLEALQTKNFGKKL